MSQITILLADNDTMICQCIRRVVEEDPQLQVRWEAHDGLQTLVLAQRHHPDILLVDSQMPRMDGIEVTRCLRMKKYPIRILVMGALEQKRELALAAGADEYITKDSGCDSIYKMLHQLAQLVELTVTGRDEAPSFTEKV